MYAVRGDICLMEQSIIAIPFFQLVSTKLSYALSLCTCACSYMYDGEIEAQMSMVFDSNKRLLAVGDIYPDTVQLGKGDYKIRVLLRHDDPTLLSSFKV